MNKSVKETSTNEFNIYCHFNEEGEDIKETLAISFIDYLNIKEKSKPLVIDNN
jgi:hypothetical protein